MAEPCSPPNGTTERRQSCEFAEAAATKAVRETFAILGVDIDVPEQVKSFQESLWFSDKLRKAADRGFLVFIGAVALAASAALWIGIVSKIKGD